ncbi:MAG TPA: FtsX-like permease family protein [Candidatus Deferrimicrobium sp.]|nr:FtsX-like permease family protein [Candidatus Deferrimicrobium sp.]
MKLNDIAINNLRRRKGKTLFLLITFLVIVGTTVGLNAISFGLKQQMEQKINSYGANIVISPKSEHLALSYGGLSVPGVTYSAKPLDSSVLEKLKQIKTPANVTSVAPKLIASVSGTKQKYLLVGIDFKTELAMKSSWKIQGAVPGKEEAVIGSRLAMRDKIGPGDKLILGGKELKISGILEETGSSSDLAVFMNFESVRELTGMGETFNLIEVNARNPEITAQEISAVLPEVKVALVSQLVQGTSESSGRFESFSWYVTLLMGFIGTLIVMVTLAGNINDRSRELGIFRAIGFRQNHVLRILVAEVLVVSTVGGLVGYLLGISVPTLLGTLITGQKLAFSWYPILGAGAIISASLIGLAAIAYPAWRIVKLDPSEALRFI